jgi:hypothetical protein
MERRREKWVSTEWGDARHEIGCLLSIRTGLEILGIGGPEGDRRCANKIRAPTESGETEST